MSEGTSKRVDRATRLIAADAQDVYQAFVDPEAILKWLPPKGARATLEAFEPRDGGAFCMKLVFEGADAHGKTDDNSDVVRGTFERLVPGQLITQRFRFVSEDPDFAGTMTMRWSLRREDEGTRVSIAAEDVPRGISPADHQKGLESSLENLAALFS